MSMSPKATLAYGFYLGCPKDEGWLVEEAGEFGKLDAPWTHWTYESLHGLSGCIIRVLLEADGLSKTELRDLGFSRWDGELARRKGLEVVVWGHLEYPRYTLASSGLYQAHAYQAQEVIFTDVDEEADDDLAWALQALKITPKQSKATWLLMPSYQ